MKKLDSIDARIASKMTLEIRPFSKPLRREDKILEFNRRGIPRLFLDFAK